MLFDYSVALLGALSLSATTVSAQVRAYDKIDFTNVGFAGTYFPVKSFSDITKDSCSCEVADAEWFSGTNAPLAEYVSVHLRGPLSLSKFAFYNSPGFVANDSRSSSAWTRQAYYDGSAQVGENVTFLARAGKDSPCLGKALTYAGADGVSSASQRTVLGGNNSIASDQEYIIYSNVSCPKSGLDRGCGVYRKGIPAYYGFGGVTKMFLFEFEMPTETKQNSSSIEFFDMPAIWLLNDHIARTAQYPTNANCSCWASGCGEFDIFEVMNGTERNHLYSTFHTFQGIEDLGTGIQSYGYIPRNTTGTMKGGVVFDSAGNTITFMSDDVSFDANITSDAVQSLLSSVPRNETYSSQLMSISATAPASSTGTKNGKSNGALLSSPLSGIWYYIFTVVTAVGHFLI
ncbi:Toh1p KNAG_0C02390 [Huiozyma naganishii CBS 8797]|uniref:glucan endo-1,3-beta-D-glucosidase n=1 Tax=Huiozyma naganishii (strain ATCC MYA-139 / BCRC 22969 / CBS 8797 / KCTC 17520 / NBRC 10181 / NCYC 3082 / Yp74L-3) TaxID=1071383 RepID=J7R3E5_HUIN7|nr:hypothetical protein KNAG_0C02390 [Kazachstania naganishii CBS 8797]CCK69350.1 hypothetical protein KNAG_0C02390 [Kazachstania naganishii CBS 8797]